MRVEKREFAREFSQTFIRRSNEVRIPLRIFPSHLKKACKFFNYILRYFAEPATTKCKPVAVLQLSSTLMTGQTRTNSHQLSSKFEPVA